LDAGGAAVLESLGINYQGTGRLVVLVIEPEASAEKDIPRTALRLNKDTSTPISTLVDEGFLHLESDPVCDDPDDLEVCETEEVDAEDTKVIRLTPPRSKPETPARPAPLLLTPSQRTDLVRPKRPISKRLGQRPRPVPLYLSQKQRIDQTVDDVAWWNVSGRRVAPVSRGLLLRAAARHPAIR